MGTTVACLRVGVPGPAILRSGHLRDTSAILVTGSRTTQPQSGTRASETQQRFIARIAAESACLGRMPADVALAHFEPMRRQRTPSVAIYRGKLHQQGKALTHAHLLRRVWGHGYETDTYYVHGYIWRLRAKLKPDGGTPLILTEPRAGTALHRSDRDAALNWAAAATPTGQGAGQRRACPAVLMNFSHAYVGVNARVYFRRPSVFPDSSGPAVAVTRTCLGASGS